LTRKTADFGAQNEMHRAKLGGHGVRAEEIFPNWGHMLESDTRSQSYGQITAAHSEIAPIRPDYDFLPILRWSACSRYLSAINVQSDSWASSDSDPPASFSLLTFGRLTCTSNTSHRPTCMVGKRVGLSITFFFFKDVFIFFFQFYYWRDWYLRDSIFFFFSLLFLNSFPAIYAPSIWAENIFLFSLFFGVWYNRKWWSTKL
jgi:hypothetical protein